MAAEDLIDISLPVSSASVVWPSAPRPEIDRRLSMERSDAVNDSNLFMNVHTGTHIDAPLHHLANGSAADLVPLDRMIGRVSVLDLSAHAAIDSTILERHWPSFDASRVLFKTRNSNLWATGKSEFVTDYCALTADTGDWLVERNVRLVGIDYLSIQRFADPPTVHRVLLAAGVVLLEGLDLSQVVAGTYELICLPLKLVGADGAPARAVLRRLE